MAVRPALLFALFLLPAQAISAQSISDTLHYSAAWQLTGSENARYRAVRTLTDPAKGTGRIATVDLESGKPVSLERFANVYRGIKHGVQLRYHPDGSLKSLSPYKTGALHDTVRAFHPGGALRRISVFDNGTHISSQCWDTDSTATGCPPLIEPPAPAGGDKDLRKLREAIRYPAVALQQRLEGQVKAAFMVYRDGTTGDASLVKSVHTILDQEVLRVIRSSTLRWLPGTFDGDPVDMHYTFPVVFKVAL